MIAPEFAETLQQEKEPEMRGDLCCITCGIAGGFLAIIAIAVCQNWQAIASIFS